MKIFTHVTDLTQTDLNNITKESARLFIVSLAKFLKTGMEGEGKPMSIREPYLKIYNHLKYNYFTDYDIDAQFILSTYPNGSTSYVMVNNDQISGGLIVELQFNRYPTAHDGKFTNKHDYSMEDLANYYRPRVTVHGVTSGDIEDGDYDDEDAADTLSLNMFKETAYISKGMEQVTFIDFMVKLIEKTVRNFLTAPDTDTSHSTV